MSPENLDERLEAAGPTLSQTEQAELWQRIAPQVGIPVSSPYLFVSFVRTRVMVPLAAFLIVVLGTGSMVAVSEAAKPGDLLFPIDRATERARLALASDERALELRAAFAAERLSELEEILTEDGVVQEIEDTDEATTSPRTRGRIIVDDASEVRISQAATAMLDLLEGVDDSSVRESLLTALITQIDNVSVRGRVDRGRGSDDSIDLRTEDSRIRIDDDRIEIRADGYRLRVDDDGEVRIKSDNNRSKKFDDASGHGRGKDDSWKKSDSREEESDDRDDSDFRRSEVDDDSHSRGRDDDNEDDDDDDDDNDEDEDDEDGEVEGSHDSQPDLGKIEVRVEDGEAEVRVWYDGQEYEYETIFVSRTLLIAEIAARTGIPSSDIGAVLDLEIKD